MPGIYRIRQPGREPVVDVATVEAIVRTIRDGDPGCFHFDEIGPEALPSGHTSRRSGVGYKRPDGVVVLDPDPSTVDHIAFETRISIPESGIIMASVRRA
jgi:hypothetical protein